MRKFIIAVLVLPVTVFAAPPKWIAYERLPLGDLASYVKAERAENAARGIEELGAPSHPMCRKAGLTAIRCDSNNRYRIASFLAAHGVELFPRSGKYEVPGYNGTAAENKLLAEALVRNTSLFREGNLTAEAVRRWK